MIVAVVVVVGSGLGMDAAAAVAVVVAAMIAPAWVIVGVITNEVRTRVVM